MRLPTWLFDREYWAVWLFESPQPFYWRTWLRGRVPWALVPLVPKRHLCPPSRHSWYRHKGSTWHCYHCRGGVRITAERYEGV